MLDDIETARENAKERISENGVGTERVRHWILAKLEPRLKAFCAHASIADLVALEEALELSEELHHGRGRATLVEAFMRVLEVSAELRAAFFLQI